MRAAGLKPIATVLESSALLIKSKHPSNPSLVNLIAARIKGVISSSSPLKATTILRMDADVERSREKVRALPI